MRNARLSVWITFPVLLLASGIVGCGSRMSQVSGTVTGDGKPLSNVSVDFLPKEGRPSGAVTDDNGRYVLMYTSSEKGARPGVYTVHLRRVIPPDLDKGISPREIKFDFEQSVEVTKGSNVFDFDVPASAIPKDN